MRLRHVLTTTVLAFLIIGGQPSPLVDGKVTAVRKEVTAMPKTKLIPSTPVKSAKKVSHKKDSPVRKKTPPNKVSAAKKSVKILTVTATAYVNNCQGCIGITKLGIDVRKKITYKGMGIIAVDPDIIPLRSIVEIDGEKYYAGDIGGGIDNREIDILMKNTKEALNFGRQKIRIKVYNL